MKHGMLSMLSVRTTDPVVRYGKQTKTHSTVMWSSVIKTPHLQTLGRYWQ